MRNSVSYLIVMLCFFILQSCAVKKHTDQRYTIGHDSLLNTASYGLKIVDLDKGTTLHSLNSDRFFIPASNTKLLTMYAGLRTFGDSIPGWSIAEDNNHIYLEPNGDPTFLNDEFPEQRIFEILKNTHKTLRVVMPGNTAFGRFGSGWSWGTWQETYSPERSVMPVYNNMVRFYKEGNTFKAIPSFFNNLIEPPTEDALRAAHSIVLRAETSNHYKVQKNSDRNSWIRPFTGLNNDTLAYMLLSDTLRRANAGISMSIVRNKPDHLIFSPVHTVATDTLFAKLMKRSDNFFAEQMMLMAGKIRYGSFADFGTIRKLRGDLFDGILDQGKWVDGSGLSRGNLISPDEFVKLLTVIYKSNDFERVKRILPSGNEGTLRGLYKGYESHIWAKTGTLADHLGLSGYLKTKKGNNLAFSFLINNYRGSANDYRKKIEEILIWIIEHD
ncbi:D-alanyl-D-alanine carboxypeptidase [Sphingobacterium faecale]|uniref:D-alanyl-D-alanine carboxypeptidase n=1 Tax=Sphingobacterium faecale TaxID=2803775 RepID=A0ABS1R8K5_9SPHI|nr:D-alanyl-D-alanine carboxypeptidase [Sphingobacterium faecale]MBL1411049.1 D-alanyl-D-alanine carboxypeptidase [Sphingobacterium faecale]